MADKNKPAKSSYATRSSIGALFKAATLSTDPGHTLSFTMSLINQSRASLAGKLEQAQPDPDAISRVLNMLLHALACRWVDNGIIEEETRALVGKRIDEVFKSESKMRSDLEVYRDVGFCDDLHERWIHANEIYLMNPNAWSHSNELLSEIHKQLMEIIARHDLMEFPRGESFNLDEHGTDVGTIAAMLATRRSSEAMDEQRRGD